MRAAFALLLLALALPASAQDPAGDPTVRPRPLERLEDPEFGIASGGYALRREVQMVQWVPGVQGDRLAWRDLPVPADGLDAGHRNPAELPFAAAVWRTPAPMPDGRDLAPALLEGAGEWRLLHPDPGQLPPNLAATFQASGDVLTTAADPQRPQAGDLRVRWAELVLPPEAGFVPGPAGWVAASPGAAARAETAAASAEAPPAPDGPVRWRYGVAAVLLLALVAGLAWRRRARP
ncbi:hypothetical protein LDO32_08505 [Luteimonas sp. Y-2-2-4F]|nr:hypothetical protein [Luteimonas sp. Y-2-2-4F]MCD9031762.1 hypothetical protein [Luteimonas sp. Y-2-2-4F]